MTTKNNFAWGNMKITNILKALLPMLMLAVGAVTAQAGVVSTVYERGTANNPWTNADLTEWTGTASAQIDADKGLYFEAEKATHSLSIENLQVDEYALLTIDAVWFTGRAYNNSNTYLSIGDAITFETYGQEQLGQVVIGGSKYTVANAVKKNKNRDSDYWTIHAEINTATGVISTLTIAGQNGSPTASLELTDVAMPSGAKFTTLSIGYNRVSGSGLNVGLPSIVVKQETQEVATADYTVNWTDENDQVLKSDTRTSTVGNTITLASADVQDFTLGDITYIYDSNDAEGKTVADDNSTVITIKCHQARMLTYTVNEVCDGTTVRTIEGTALETSSVKVAYRRFNALKTTLQAEIVAAKVLLTENNEEEAAVRRNTTKEENIAAAKAELEAAIAQAEAALDSNMLNIGELEAIVQTLKAAQTTYTEALNEPDPETTGIAAMQQTGSAMPTVYDMQGRRVTATRNGIYVINGKKVVIK